MKTNANNKGAAKRPVTATVNVACMSQKELIARLNNSNKKLQALNKELSAIEAKRAKNPDKVELIIDALIVKKKVIDEVSESLVAATS